MDPFIFLLALHWRKILALIVFVVAIDTIQSCFGG
jgi:hypothetical protein